MTKAMTEESPPSKEDPFADRDAELEACAVVEVIIRKSWAQIKENQMAARVKPYATEEALIEMNRVLQWSAVVRDNGEQDEPRPPPPPDQRAMWNVEDQPIAQATDKWARGAVTTKPKTKKISDDNLPTTPGDGAPSTSRSGTGSRRPMSSRLNSTVEVKPEPVQLVDLGQPGKGKGPAIEYTDAEKEYFKAMKEEQERKRQMEAAEAQRIAEEHEEMERWEKQMQDLKGKEYTFDVNGEIILVNALKPESLPNACFQIPTQVTERKLDGKPPPKKGKKKKRGKQRGPISDGSEIMNHFERSATQQPSIFEVVTVNSGVSIKEGEGVQAGPAPMEDDKHWSRKTYNLRRTGDSVTEDESRRAEEEMDLPGSLDMSSVTGDDFSEEAASPTNVPQSTNLNKPQDDGSFAGGKKKVDATPEEEEEEDENLKMIRAPDWGQIGPIKDPHQPVLPHKPDIKQKQTILSPRPKHPRDRLSEHAVVHTKDASRLPAPPLGLSTGHGFFPRPYDGPAVEEDHGTNPLSSRSGMSDRSFLPVIKQSAPSPSNGSVTGSPDARRLLLR